MGLFDRIPSLKDRSAEPPQAIDVDERGEFTIVWPDGRRVTIPPVQLRDQCPCAACIEEGTGRKILDRAAIPSDIRPVGVEPVGNYAIRVRWSDGHDTGIYTWETLRRASGR